MDSRVILFTCRNFQTNGYGDEEINGMSGMNEMNGVLSAAVNEYLMALGHLSAQFTQWGKMLFCGLLVINMMWFWVWLGFQKGEFDQGLVIFLKKFFIMLVFYTLMINHQFFMSLLQSAQVMGKTLTHGDSDPSSIISDGIALSNQLIRPILSFNLFKITFGVINIMICYFIILFVFMTVALRLAVALIETTALITVSSFFLGFAALSATSKIAHSMIEAIIASCVKLVGLYLVIGTGMAVIQHLAQFIPAHEATFDDYWWLLSVVLLFWCLSKSLPDLLARLVSVVVSNDSHVDTAALVMTGVKYASMRKSVIKDLI